MCEVERAVSDETELHMRSGRADLRGFTYLGVLFGISFIGIALASAGQVWSSTVKRERAVQLNWVCEQFRLAVNSYRAATPIAPAPFPTTFEDLLADGRFNPPKRHLRRIYVDPMAPQNTWSIELRWTRNVVTTASITDAVSTCIIVDEASIGR